MKNFLETFFYLKISIFNLLFSIIKKYIHHILHAIASRGPCRKEACEIEMISTTLSHTSYMLALELELCFMGVTCSDLVSCNGSFIHSTDSHSLRGDVNVAIHDNLPVVAFSSPNFLEPQIR